VRGGGRGKDWDCEGKGELTECGGETPMYNTRGGHQGAVIGGGGRRGKWGAPEGWKKKSRRSLCEA